MQAREALRDIVDIELVAFPQSGLLLRDGTTEMMNRALEKAWARPIGRFWVHTCTLDHPAALAFYQRSGFTVFKRGVEVDDDPRLTGKLRRDSVEHHPIIA